MRDTILALLAAGLLLLGTLALGRIPASGATPNFDLLGIYKPKGFAIIFDHATGVVLTTPLPKELAQQEAPVE